jgi:4-amino-4-deoxy-L-arabinose transferase-like glycosyltransferase
MVEDLNAARRAHAALNALLVALSGLLAWRLFGLGLGLLVGGLLALDPFLVAHAQVIRMDGLQAGLLGVGLLCCLVRWTAGGGRWYLFGGGLALGLALVSKTSSVVIGVPLLLCGGWHAVAQRRAGASVRAVLSATLSDFAILGGATLLAAVVAWPALWVAPLETLQRLADFTLWNGGSPPESGNYFLGQPIPDPGVWFYPLALLYRLTPLAIGGLVLLAFFTLPGRPGSRPVLHRAVPWLLLTATIFVFALTPAPKKYDRYLLPIWIPLLLLAGLGWQRLVLAAGRRRTLVGAAVGLLLLAQVVWLPPLAPYALAYYNPLAGGPTTAYQVIPVGWGEGLEQAAAALNARSEGDRPVVATLYSEPLRANLSGISLPLRRYAEAEVLVDYVNMEQRRLLPPALRAVTAATVPIWQLDLDGVTMVRIFDLPRSEFGEALRIERQLLDEDRADRGERLLVTLRWRALAPWAVGWRPRVALLDDRGQAVVAAEASQSPIDVNHSAEEVFRLRLPRERGDLRLALAVLDEQGRAVEPTAFPPWAERTPDGLSYPPIVVSVR